MSNMMRVLSDEGDEFQHIRPEEQASDDDLPQSPSSAGTPFFSYAEDRAFTDLDAKYWAQAHPPASSPPASMSFRRSSATPSLTPSQSALSDSFRSLHLDNHSRNSTTEGSFLLERNAERSPVRTKTQSASSVDDPYLKPAGPSGLGLPEQRDSANSSRPQGAAEYITHDEDMDIELQMICKSVQKCLEIRHKYISRSNQGPRDNPRDQPDWKIYPAPPAPSWTASKEPRTNKEEDSVSQMSPSRPEGADGVGWDFNFEACHIPEIKDDIEFSLDNTGVYQVSKNIDGHRSNIVQVPSIREYYMDLEEISNTSSDGPSKSFAFRRLQYLEASWNLYILTNEYQELADTKRNPHRDFYNVRKVDTHVHHSACMNQKHLLRFIKSKMKKCPDEVVIFRDGKLLTLQQVFESLNLTAYDLSIDTLDMHAHRDTFHRFDKFNLKYNPIGESRLREIFLKTDNYIKGKYLAELTREVFYDLEQSKYQMAEYRISIYGKSLNEWDRLAEWVVDYKLFSSNVRWLIQFPRLYEVYKATGIVNNFEQIIKNIFQPLFEVSKDPSSHPKLHVFLQRVIGFDSVDDESKPERRLYRKFPYPSEWTTAQNPPYSYYLYYLYANMTSLNALRKGRGFNTLVLRPHSGEAGDTEHLVSAFLIAHSISHGILLRKVPFLQYLFYLDKVGIAMSPLSNNALFLAYDKNPFFSYFKRGLNISLSTDDPLQFAYTKEALIEEYSVAAQIYRLSSVDMCELAKNSVLQSGFEAAVKEHWLGQGFDLPGSLGTHVEKSNVPAVRVDYRQMAHDQELSLVYKYSEASKDQSQPSVGSKSISSVSTELSNNSSSPEHTSHLDPIGRRPSMTSNFQIPETHGFPGLKHQAVSRRATSTALTEPSPH
ncbi:AMP deaminase [Myxozyma melibiosi]|uniref:AMP deaminase n=1 Tax=Myxozyma melibiosi TaxID=54550 RepID=A0ABR1EYC7_9ASCO